MPGGDSRRARRRTLMVAHAVNKKRNEDKEEAEQQEPREDIEIPDSSEKLEKLGRLLKDKGVITEIEYNLIFE